MKLNNKLRINNFFKDGEDADFEYYDYDKQTVRDVYPNHPASQIFPNRPVSGILTVK